VCVLSLRVIKKNATQFKIGNYATKNIRKLRYQNIRLIKKNITQFKISNKHVFCQHIITHLHFFIVRSHEISKVKEFEMI